MTYNRLLKLSFCAGLMLVLAACAATPKSSTATYAEPVNQKEVALITANELTATKNVTKSADGTLTCKRQEVAGSRFKRKICMTNEEWEDLAAKNRATMKNLHRRSSQQTRPN